MIFYCKNKNVGSVNKFYTPTFIIEPDELKQEKREIKKQLQLVEGIMKEDLYTPYCAVSENEEIVGDREIEIPKMEENTVVEDAVEPDTNATIMNPANSQNDKVGQQEQTDGIKEQQIALYDTGMLDMPNVHVLIW